MGNGQDEPPDGAKSRVEEIEALAVRAIEASVTCTEAAAAIAAVRTQTAAASAQISADQAVIATKSEHIQAAQDHADKVRADLDRAVAEIGKNTADAEALKLRAQLAADGTVDPLAAIAARKATVDEHSSEIAAARDSAKAIEQSLQSLLARAELAEGRVDEYQKNLAALEAQCKAQLQTIVDLLPGATSAGLASAFDSRRKTFLDPSKRWQWIFVGSVVLLVVLALSGFLSARDSGTSYEALGRLWLARLPIAAALIWLALHSARESALSKRLEEDYGYKATIAASFMGFNQQMSRIGDEATPGSPLARLCTDTLATLASPPGQIYDKHALTTTPLKEIKESLESLMKKVEPQKPSAESK